MDKDFYMGIMIGLVGGAVATANSFKLRRAVKEGQEQVMSAINNMASEKKDLMEDSDSNQ